MIRRGALAGLLTLLACVSLARADDWPQWRGPARSGISKETGLLKQWPEKGPQLLWKLKGDGVGFGFSSFAVVGDVLYTLGTKGNDEYIIAFDVVRRGNVWNTKIGPIFTFKGNTWGDGPRSTPTIDGNYLYALGGQGELVCVDITQKGKEVWRKNLIKDFNGQMMSEWGYSESPLVDGERLICTPGGADGTLAALDKKTGAVIWRSKELKHLAPYTSVTAAEINGVRQYIQLGTLSDKNDGFLSGVAAADGKVLWYTPLFKGYVYSLASSPPIVVDNTVYVTYLSETTSNCHRFAIDKDFQVKDLYTGKSNNAIKNNHGGVVLVGDHIYGYSERAGWVCQDFKTGKALWNERDAIEGGGSIIAADGRLYIYTDQGEVILAEANPKEWTEISRFKIPETSKLRPMAETSSSAHIWAHPAIASGRLYLRDAELIFCYDIRAK
jgi:outer membrane protein assembly factor BamB